MRHVDSLDFAQSKDRQIDDNTLIDLLAIIEYQASRSEVLEGIGFTDNESPDDALLTFVLDALNVPREGAKKVFEENVYDIEEKVFTRSWFEEKFYADYLLGSDVQQTLKDVIEMFRKEVKHELNSHYI